MNLLPDIQEARERNGTAVKDKKDKPRPGFQEIYEERLERRRLELRRASVQRSEIKNKQMLPDYSMQKLFLSMLMRLGGSAPFVPAGDPDGSTVTLHALQARRFSSRRPFSQDSGLFSMPQYPFVSDNVSGVE